MCNMLVAKSSCSLSSQFERHTPATKSHHRLNYLKKQLSAYKNATADNAQVYDGHDMVPQYFRNCRRNSGALRAELSAKNGKKREERNVKSSSGKSTESDLAAGYTSFNQDERSTSTSITAPSCVSKASNSSGTKSVQTSIPTKPMTNPVDVPKSINSISTRPKNEVVSSSSTQKMIRRKKSSPHHRDHDMNLKLPSIMRSPRYSKCRPGDLASSLLDLSVTDRVVDERLTKSLTDLEVDWGDSLDFNSVHFRKNVEVYIYNP